MSGWGEGMASQHLVERWLRAPTLRLLFPDAGNPARGGCGGQGAGLRRLLRGGAGQSGDPGAALPAAAYPVREAGAGEDGVRGDGVGGVQVGEAVPTLSLLRCSPLIPFREVF